MNTDFIRDWISFYQLDCMDLMKKFPDKHFDLALVDPPYGRKEHGGTNRAKGVKQKNGKILHCNDGNYQKKHWDNKPPEKEYFTELKRVSKNQIVWGINYFPVHWPGGRIIWDKVNDGSDQSGAEIAYCSFNDRVDIVRYMWRGMMQGDRVGSMCQQGNKSLNEKRIHPTQKPVKLYSYLLSQYTKPGQLILDTHVGSGSLAIACYEAGLHFTGSEADPDYYSDACSRINNETAQERLAF